MTSMQFVVAMAIGMFLLPSSACKSDNKKLKKGTVQYEATIESKDSKVTGTVLFTQAPGDPLEIRADVTGLSAGPHAVHIHTTGNCARSAKGFTKVGGHFMGGMKMMKGMKHTPMGDIGGFEADANGVSKTVLSAAKLSLFKGPTSVQGRSILIHAGPVSKPGAKVACGVISPKS